MPSRIVLAALLLLALTAGVVHAQGFASLGGQSSDSALQPTPSWIGSTGLIMTPSATTLGPSKAQGAYHRFERDSVTQSAYSANTGLSSGLEVGVARLTNVPKRAPLTGFADRTIYNAKWALPVSKMAGLGDLVPQVAVGVWDLQNDVNRDWYVVLSKQLMPSGGVLGGVVAHLGFGRNDLREGPLDGIFGGVEISPFDKALIQVEYDAQDINACLRYYVADMLALDVGTVDSDFAWGVTLATPF